jgi:hypothetical protein
MIGLDPNEVLKGTQRVEVTDEGFTENPKEVFDNEFEKMYKEFISSDFVAALDNDQLFKKIKEYFDGLSLEGRKQFIEHCIIDMTTLHLNAMSQLVQIRQNLFTDTYSKNPVDALDSRWMDIFLYQIAGLAFSNTIPGPIQVIKQQKG